MYASVAAAHSGARVLVACPTGALVSTYRERVVEDERIVVQTIHSSFRVARAADMATYNPPSSLNQFELIVIEEASQIDNLLFSLLLMAIMEMPQRPFVCIVGDFAQLQPVGGGLSMKTFAERLRHIGLLQHEFARSKASSTYPIILTNSLSRIFFHQQFFRSRFRLTTTSFLISISNNNLSRS